MSTDQLAFAEVNLDQRTAEPLKIFSQHASTDLAAVLGNHSDLEVIENLDLQTAKERAGQSADFDSVNFKMVAPGIKAAQESVADLLFFSNNEQDQLGICARRTEGGNFQILTSHQISLLLCEIILENYKEEEKTEGVKEPLVIRSIALTEGIDVQSAYKGVKHLQCYSGVNVLQAAIEESRDEYSVLIAMDEANHFLFPDLSIAESIDRAIKLMAEKALELKREGLTLFDYLISLYRQYGFYHEKSFTISREDVQGEKYIKNIMAELRRQTPDALFGKSVRVVNDFYKGTSYNLLNAKKLKTSLPKADILQFLFADYSKVTFFPLDDYSKLFYHFSVNSRLAGKEAYDEEKKRATDIIISMMGKIGKI